MPTSPRVPVWVRSIRKQSAFWDKLEKVSDAIWNHRITNGLLLLSPYVISTWLWFRPQLPGVAAVLLGGIAAIMTFREMHHTHKLLFTGAILSLIFLEARDIRKDRLDTDHSALEERKNQDTQFKSVRDKQDQEFQETANGLRKAIAGIDTTIQSVKETYEQTRPAALIHFADGINVQNPPQPPALFEAGVDYDFNSQHSNDGNDDAQISKILLKVYVGKPDDKESQRLLVVEFEREWNNMPTKPPSIYPAHHVGFLTIHRRFSSEEISRLSGSETVYLLRRILYSDSTGHWQSEDCQHLQISQGALYIRVAHSCLVFLGNRIPVR